MNVDHLQFLAHPQHSHLCQLIGMCTFYDKRSTGYSSKLMARVNFALQVYKLKKKNQYFSMDSRTEESLDKKPRLQLTMPTLTPANLDTASTTPPEVTIGRIKLIPPKRRKYSLLFLHFQIILILTRFYLFKNDRRRNENLIIFFLNLKYAV